MSEKNVAAARSALEYVYTHPAEAPTVLAMAVFDQLARDYAIYKSAFQSTLDKFARARKDDAAQALLRKYVETERAGQPNEEFLEAYTELRKDFDFTEQELSGWAKQRQRDSSGRFKKEVRRFEPIKLGAKQAQAMNINLPYDSQGVQLWAAEDRDSQEMRRQYRGYVAQARKTVEPLRGQGQVRRADLYFRNAGTGEQGMVTFPGGHVEDEAIAQIMANGGIPEGMEVQWSPDLNVDNVPVNLLRGLTGDPVYAGDAAARAKGKPKGLYEAWNSDKGTSTKPRERAYARTAAAADLVDALTPYKTPEQKVAVEAAKWAAQNGQNVENAVGPTAERAAYRYRGTRRKVGSAVPGKKFDLQRDLDWLRRASRDNRNVADGLKDDAARLLFITGTDKAVDGATGNELKIGDRKYNLSPVRDYLTGTLPKQELVQFQRESGRGTPSHGLIIDRSGKIAVESTGMGEDHYLPFKLADLKALKGGEYARTRAWGGPTTEDLYTSLVSGARAFTVVSHSGTYTVEFADDFRGSRRFSDRAVRMMRVYSGLLDTLRTKEHKGELSGERRAELREKATQAANPLFDYGAGRRTKLQQLEAQEREAPQLTRRQTQELLDTLIAEEAGKTATKSGYMTPEQFEAERLRPAVKTLQLETGSRAAGEAEIVGALEQMRPGAAARWDRLKGERLASLRDELEPWELDGRGYERALLALQEQFPYAITRVDYRPAAQNATDKYYVRPGDTRPVEVKVGYGEAPNSVRGRGSGAKGGKASAAAMYGRTGFVGSGAPAAQQGEQKQPQGETTPGGQQQAAQQPQRNPDEVKPSPRRMRAAFNKAAEEFGEAVKNHRSPGLKSNLRVVGAEKARELAMTQQAGPNGQMVDRLRSDIAADIAMIERAAAGTPSWGQDDTDKALMAAVAKIKPLMGVQSGNGRPLRNAAEAAALLDVTALRGEQKHEDLQRLAQSVQLPSVEPGLDKVTYQGRWEARLAEAQKKYDPQALGAALQGVDRDLAKNTPEAWAAAANRNIYAYNTIQDEIDRLSGVAVEGDEMVGELQKKAEVAAEGFRLALIGVGLSLHAADAPDEGEKREDAMESLRGLGFEPAGEREKETVTAPTPLSQTKPEQKTLPDPNAQRSAVLRDAINRVIDGEWAPGSPQFDAVLNDVQRNPGLVDEVTRQKLMSAVRQQRGEDVS